MDAYMKYAMIQIMRKEETYSLCYKVDKKILMIYNVIATTT